MARNRITMHLICIWLAMFTILISVNAVFIGPKSNINSYPLAINFDVYRPMLSSQQRVTVPRAPQQQDYHAVHDYSKILYSRANDDKTDSSIKKELRFPKTSQVFMLAQPTTTIPTIINCDNCKTQSTSNSNFKRTLDSSLDGSKEMNINGTIGDSKKSPYNRGPTDPKKLLLIRQKMIDMQGRNANVSIEDTNWKIAAACLSSQFGAQFIRNRDVKCASSQVVLSISRMQRASCKYCDSYFHCEGFSNALKRCKNNYDVQETLKVLRECQGLTNGDSESIEATRSPILGLDCQKEYLCRKNCMYNPMDGTCPRNNCFLGQLEEVDRYSYRSYMRNRNIRPTNFAYPDGSPIKQKILATEKRD